MTDKTKEKRLKHGDTLKFMYIKYQPILVVLPKVYQKVNYVVTRTIYES